MKPTDVRKPKSCPHDNPDLTIVGGGEWTDGCCCHHKAVLCHCGMIVSEDEQWRGDMMWMEDPIRYCQCCQSVEPDENRRFKLQENFISNLWDEMEEESLNSWDMYNSEDD